MNSIFISNINVLPFLVLAGMVAFILYDLSRFWSVRQEQDLSEKRLRQKYSQSEVLNSLYETASHDQSKETRINWLLDDLENKLGWKILAYLDFLESEQVIVFRSVRGLSQKYRDFVHEVFHDKIGVGTVAGGRAISTKQPVVVNDWNKDPHLRDLDFLSEYGHIGSFAAFPIVSSLKTYGSLHVYGTRVGEFTLNEVQFFTTIANSLAAILEHDGLRLEGGDKNGNDIGQGQENH